MAPIRELWKLVAVVVDRIETVGDIEIDSVEREEEESSLAIMVEFVPDKDSRSIGGGGFELPFGSGSALGEGGARFRVRGLWLPHRLLKPQSNLSIPSVEWAIPIEGEVKTSGEEPTGSGLYDARKRSKPFYGQVRH